VAVIKSENVVYGFASVVKIIVMFITIAAIAAIIIIAFNKTFSVLALKKLPLGFVFSCVTDLLSVAQFLLLLLLFILNYGKYGFARN